MFGWELRLIAPHENALDGSLLSQLETAGHETQVCRIELPACNAAYSRLVGDLFSVKRRADEKVVIAGDCSFLHRLAHQWTSRSLTIDGNVGAALGIQMRGGRLEVHGNAMDNLACQMRGGLIHVKGDVGNYLGGPMAGRRSGMSGGRVKISGNAGHYAGHRMRRGTVIIEGHCGDALASDMVAGTMIVKGAVGNHVAAGMKRGTVVLHTPAHLDAIRFTQPRPERLSIMRLLEQDLQTDASEIGRAMRFPISRCLGDLSAGGRGEIWTVQYPASASAIEPAGQP